jgi:hypothetical protein
LDSKLYQLIWSPLLTNYTHELMTAKQNTNNRHLTFWHWKKVRSTSEKMLTFFIDLLFWSDAIVSLFVSLLDIQLHASIGVRVKASFNDISAISWRSVLLVWETGKNHWHILSHNIILSIPRHERDSNS